MPAAEEQPATKIRDRIKELRRVRAGDLIANVRNWRKHPAAQVRALKGSLEEIGWSDVAIAYEVDGELVLIDGHARAGIDENAMVPVVVLDVNEEEANKLLATLDPITAMARTDQSAFEELVADVECSTDELAHVIKKMMPGTIAQDLEAPEIEQLPTIIQIVVECKDEADQEGLFHRLTEEGYKCRVLTL